MSQPAKPEGTHGDDKLPKKRAEFMIRCTSDTFLTIVETCKKLGINCYDYFLDRIRGLSAIPPLAEIISAKSTS